ncbi:type II toxin-antitoxin system prevent-host-death family antitoxin [soil metagenome]
MREVGVLEVKTHLSALLDAIENDGETMTITRHGRAIATLGPVRDTGQVLARKTPAKELVARFKALRDSIATANPDAGNLTWEELKQMARE